MKKNQFAHLKKKKNWIGFVINSELGTLYIAEDRTKSICVKEIIQKLPYTTARKFETFWGKIFSTKLVKGNLVQLRTRNLYKAIKQQSPIGLSNQYDFMQCISRGTILFEK